jgi:GntR family transcriptional repressor for pyruvate dehydrogenase complex
MTADHNKDTGIESLHVNRARLSEQVAEQIQSMIIQGKIKQGDRLPPERELAEQLGVSRTVIRESTKVLQERGLVKVLTGSGTYATRVESENVSQSIGLFVRGKKHAFRDLLEIRKMLEIEVAGLAAERATEEDILQLEASLHEMQRALPEICIPRIKLEEFVQADLLFHQCLAKASKNSLLTILLEPITDLLLEFRREASSFPGAPERAVAYHQTILEYVRTHDNRKCQATMRDHISNTEEFLDLMTGNEDGPQDKLSG